ncbi:hypothetical protein MTR67_043153 [Solanum verrucosum]|uniref:Retrotransposon gag protein n=1 Tax=Solanum verrucosum TaxID=315347 RepID=A0AAF0UQS3_SOLVR|nr:hypothetical protein MTR67_043153 [Solanum verrucosum]
MVKLRDNIQNFKRTDGEPTHETWLRFKKLVLQCPTHGLLDNVLLQYFYPILNTINKGVFDQRICGGIIRQSFDIASALLDEMTKINCARYTKEDQVSPLNLGLTKEQIENNQEQHENIAKIMTKMDLLTKHVIRGGHKAMNVVGGNSGVNPHDTQFDVMYNEEEPRADPEIFRSEDILDSILNKVEGSDKKSAIGRAKSHSAICRVDRRPNIDNLLDQLNGKVFVTFDRLKSTWRFSKWIGGVNEPRRLRSEL